MSVDFRKQFENPEGFQATLQPVERPLESLPPDERDEEIARKAARLARGEGDAPEDGTARTGDTEFRNPVSFPLSWWAALLSYGIPLGGLGYAIYIAFTQQPEDGLVPLLVACGAVLSGMAVLPNTLVVDDRGVHQVHCLGLFVRTMRLSEIRSFRVTRRGQLRREGKLRWEWKREVHDDDDWQEVVFLEGRYGRRYLMHTPWHARRYHFVEELQKRGVTPHGYEDWDKFMEQRGFPNPSPRP